MHRYPPYRICNWLRLTIGSVFPPIIQLHTPSGGPQCHERQAQANQVHALLFGRIVRYSIRRWIVEPRHCVVISANICRTNNHTNSYTMVASTVTLFTHLRGSLIKYLAETRGSKRIWRLPGKS